MNRRKLLEKLLQGHVQNVSFKDFRNLVLGFGFTWDRTESSHHLFTRDDIPDIVTFRSVEARQTLSGPRVRASDRAVQSSIGGRVVSDYHINIFWSEEDGCYVADIPDLSFCSAFGDTPEEALAEVEQAKQAWLAVAREKGKPIPEPRYRPAIYQVGR